MSLSSLLQNLRYSRLGNHMSIKSCASWFSSKPPSQKIVKDVDPDTGELKSKKTNMIPKITLLSGNAITITTLAEAEKLSKRRDLKLVKITDVDTKSQRPVYQLMTGTEYHAEDLKQREKLKTEKRTVMKGEKVLLINSKISHHDLDTQIRKAVKWVQKLYEVRVIISGASGSVESSDKVYSYIEQHFNTEDSGAKIVQKRSKGADIKFQILPAQPKASRGDL